MSDTQTDTTLTVGIKNGASVSVDINMLPPEVYRAVLERGIKAIVESSGMSKLGPKYYEGGKEDPKLLADTQAKAEENVEKMLKGELGAGKAKAKTKVSGEVKTEAMRLARAKVKEVIKANGGKISHYKASEITAAAKELIEQDKSFIEQAKELLEARAAAPVKVDIMAMVKADPKLVADAEAKAAERKKNAPLSAKQAGQVKPRKGKAAAQAQA